MSNWKLTDEATYAHTVSHAIGGVRTHDEWVEGNVITEVGIVAVVGYEWANSLATISFMFVHEGMGYRWWQRLDGKIPSSTAIARRAAKWARGIVRDKQEDF